MMVLVIAWLLAPLVWLRSMLLPRLRAPRSILFMQTAKIGDYICTTPLIQLLRKRYPDAELSVLVQPVVEPLAQWQPGVDTVHALPPGGMSGVKGRLAFYRWLCRERFDMTVCVSPNQAFIVLPFLAGIRWRASVLPNFKGRSYRLVAPFLSHQETHRQGRMTVETGAELLSQLGCDAILPAKELGADPGAPDRVLPLLKSVAGKRLLGIGIGSGNRLKELDLDKLERLVAGVLALAGDIAVVLIGTKIDQERARHIARAMDGRPVIDLTDQVSLADLPVLLDQLSAYIGVDSGITYMADARGIPVVDVMGPADPEDQRPTGRKAIVIRTVLQCAPCSHAFLAPYGCAIGTRACVRDLAIELVLKAVSEALTP